MTTLATANGANFRDAAERAFFRDMERLQATLENEPDEWEYEPDERHLEREYLLWSGRDYA